MALPTLVIPESTIKLYSQTKPTRIRPYLVGEEKILLIAQQTNEPEEIDKAVRQIIKRCTFDAIDVETLPTFDVAYLFLQLRAKSVNNIIESVFRCQNEVDVEGETDKKKPCNTPVTVNINIDDIKLTVPDGHTNKIMLSDDTGMIMKYPGINAYNAALKGMDLTKVIIGCLDQIFQGEQVWEVAEADPKEVSGFVDQLPLSAVESIRTKFFDTMPRLQHKFTFLCPKCGYTEDVTLEGLDDFFD